jgi:uncharacterized membrane protein
MPATALRSIAYAMLMLFTGALVIAGGFTFLPGRIMHAVLFSPSLPTTP